MAIVDELEKKSKEYREFKKIAEEGKRHPGTEKELRAVLEYMETHTVYWKHKMKKGEHINRVSDVTDFLNYAIEIALLCKKLYNIDIDKVIDWTNIDIKEWAEDRNFSEYIKLQKESI